MNFFDRKYLPFITLFSIVFISRMPFLSAGYGVEEDSWGIALAAYHTKLTGIYEPSRFPGHPVQELIYSTLWGTGPVTFNSLCAFFSAVGALFFALILKQLHFKHYFFAALALAFVPVYYISSTYTIDFVWTLAFILIAFYCLLKNKLILCGVFLGLAIGCRITSGAMLLPFMLIIWEKDDWSYNFKNLLKIGLPMGFVAFLAYVPLITQFGFSFFMYYDQFPYPPFTKVMYKMIIGTYGVIGTLALLICITYAIFRRNKTAALFGIHPNKKIILSCFLIIGLFVISYFRLPQKSGYMITIIPFLILLMGHYLNSRMFRFLCVSFILSSFIFSINLTDKLRGSEHSKLAMVFKMSGQEIFFDPLSGPVFSDYSKRRQKINYTEEVISRTKDISDKTVVIAGWWYNEIMVTMIPEISTGSVVFEPYIDSLKMSEYISQGYKIKYLPEQNKYNDQMFGIKVTDRFSEAF